MRDRSERGRGGASYVSPGSVVRDGLYGALVAAVCTALSLILALAGFGRLYYVAVFLPFFMLACLLVAWFLYLKDDGFIRPPRTASASALPADRDGSRLTAEGWTADDPSSNGPSSNGPSSNGPSSSSPSSSSPAGSFPAGGRPELSLYAPKGDELVPRKSDGGIGARYGIAGARRALLWAAVQLGLLAAALYSWAGVGAGYFIPVVR